MSAPAASLAASIEEAAAAASAGGGGGGCDGVAILSLADGTVAHARTFVETATPQFSRQLIGIVSDARRVLEMGASGRVVEDKLKRITVIVGEKEYVLTADDRYVYAVQRPVAA
ncbi:hypothetical protein DFJ73DRAFT_968782 [Zopfochytrium polystomum]|nr:hypothetical protein DFJ73DRAFT_968782 [Zopfochytrium polystomum]